MKDGPQGDEFTSKLMVVELGTDDDGDPITSCVVEPVDGLTPKRATTKATKLTKGATIALAALHETIDECGEIPPASNHIPAGVKCVTLDQWRDYAARRGISNGDTKDALRKAFSRASDALIADKLAGCWAPYVWAAK
jgi:hypothetical protein